MITGRAGDAPVDALFCEVCRHTLLSLGQFGCLSNVFLRTEDRLVRGMGIPCQGSANLWCLLQLACLLQPRSMETYLSHGRPEVCHRRHCSHNFSRASCSQASGQVCAAIWCLGGPGTAVVSAATSSSSHHLQHSQSSLQVTEDMHLGLPPARVSEGERAASRRSSPLDYAALRKASLLVLDTL